LAACLSARAQTTALTYQGWLTVAGMPANGSYDFRTTVVDSDNETALTLAGPKTNSAVVVSNGLFNLTLDFGEAAFSGAAVWLELGVRPTGNGSFNSLLPRQPINSAPYALRAKNFSGLVSNSQLSANVALLNVSQTFTANKSFGSGSQLFAWAGGASSPGVTFNGDSNSGLFQPATDTVALATSGTERLRINSSGNVSIGGSGAPDARLGIQTPNSVNCGVHLRSGGSWELCLNQSPASVFTITNGGAARLAILPSGHVVSGNTNTSLTIAAGQSSGRSELFLAENPTASLGFILRYDGSGSNPLNFIPVSLSGEGPSVMTLERTGGFVGIGTNNPSQRLHVAGNILATGTITPNSDRNAKTDFAPVDVQAVLEKVNALSIQQWRFNAEPAGVKHFGPMAQDFRSAFGLGEIPTAIATVDADGVALAAIQGLNQKLTEELKRRDTENAELKARLEKLEALIEQRGPQKR
jgi:hypothetical protein